MIPLDFQSLHLLLLLLGFDMLKVNTGLTELCLADNGYSLLVADVRPRSEFEALLRQGKGRLRWASAEEVCGSCMVVMTSLMHRSGW